MTAQAETYCMEWLEWEGRYCRSRIPSQERICGDCLTKLRAKAAKVFVERNGLDETRAKAIASEMPMSELKQAAQ